MGFLSDTTDSSPQSPTLSSTIDDEESRLLPRKSSPNFDSPANGRQQYLSYHTLHSNTSTPSPTRFRTPTMRNNELLSGTRRSRAFTFAEANDIWADILDNTPTPTHHHRKCSTRSTPSKFDQPTCRPRPVSEALTESDIPSKAQPPGQDFNEDRLSKDGKRASSFGHKHRDNSFNGVRRSSIPIVDSERNRDRPRQRSRSGKLQPKQPQEALGGWWKMKWWRNGEGKGKAKVGEIQNVGDR